MSQTSLSGRMNAGGELHQLASHQRYSAFTRSAYLRLHKIHDEWEMRPPHQSLATLRRRCGGVHIQASFPWSTQKIANHRRDVLTFERIAMRTVSLSPPVLKPTSTYHTADLGSVLHRENDDTTSCTNRSAKQGIVISAWRPTPY